MRLLPARSIRWFRADDYWCRHRSPERERHRLKSLRTTHLDLQADRRICDDALP
jgi:hypothetical protein